MRQRPDGALQWLVLGYGINLNSGTHSSQNKREAAA
jgi:hypothetical protein